MTVSLPRAAAFAGEEVGRHDTLNSDIRIHTTAPADGSFLPGPVLLLGRPRQSVRAPRPSFCVASFGIPQISTGDLLRQHRRDRTELGLMAEELMKLGQLVPDDLVNQMVAGAPVRAGHCGADTSWMAFPARWPRPNGWMRISARRNGCLPPMVAINSDVDEDASAAPDHGARAPAQPATDLQHLFQPAAGRTDLRRGRDQTGPARGRHRRGVSTSACRCISRRPMPVISHYRAIRPVAEVDGEEQVDTCRDSYARCERCANCAAQLRAAVPADHGRS